MWIGTRPWSCRDKAAWCEQNQVGFIFDDNPEICQESLAKGLGVYPICTPREKHRWAEGNTKTFPSFDAAAEEFLIRVISQE